MHPYSQTGSRPTFRPTKPDLPFTAALTGLDSVRPIRDYFEQRRIELSDFEPNDALVKDADGARGARAPKLTRRAQTEYLIYHPHVAADDQQTRPIADKKAGVIVDMTAAHGRFTVEWFRADNGDSRAGAEINGGQAHTLRAPWPGVDCVLRLRLVE